MKNLKLSLKKEIISNLEAKEIIGGRLTNNLCDTDADCNLRTIFHSMCDDCFNTLGEEKSCIAWNCNGHVL